MVAHGASEGALGPARATSARRDAGPPRQRLAGLDGLRGVAALFVVVNHVFLRAFPGYPVAVSYTHLTLPTICSV